MTGKNLPVYGVSTKNLADFLTSEKDIMRNYSKIPPVEFRMWELDIDKSEHSQLESGQGDFDDLEGDFYDDFVIVERKKRDHGYEGASLAKEAKLMD